MSCADSNKALKKRVHDLEIENAELIDAIVQMAKSAIKDRNIAVNALPKCSICGLPLSPAHVPHDATPS